MPFATTETDLEGVMLSEICQRKTSATGSHFCLESKEQNKTKKRNQIRLRDTEGKLVTARWEGVWGSGGKGGGMKKYNSAVTQ